MVGWGGFFHSERQEGAGEAPHFGDFVSRCFCFPHLHFGADGAVLPESDCRLSWASRSLWVFPPFPCFRGLLNIASLTPSSVQLLGGDWAVQRWGKRGPGELSAWSGEAERGEIWRPFLPGNLQKAASWGRRCDVKCLKYTQGKNHMAAGETGADGLRAPSPAGALGTWWEMSPSRAGGFAFSVPSFRWLLGPRREPRCQAGDSGDSWLVARGGPQVAGAGSHLLPASRGCGCTAPGTFLGDFSVESSYWWGPAGRRSAASR